MHVVKDRRRKPRRRQRLQDSCFMPGRLQSFVGHEQDASAAQFSSQNADLLQHSGAVDDSGPRIKIEGGQRIRRTRVCGSHATAFEAERRRGDRQQCSPTARVGRVLMGSRVGKDERQTRRKSSIADRKQWQGIARTGGILKVLLTNLKRGVQGGCTSRQR